MQGLLLQPPGCALAAQPLSKSRFAPAGGRESQPGKLCQARFPAGPVEHIRLELGGTEGSPEYSHRILGQ